MNHELPKGEMMHRDKPVDLIAIRRCAIMAVEGEKDDISGVGQTLAALDLTPNLPSDKKVYHLQEGVGHYGVFNGKRFRSEIAPRIAEFIEKAGRRPPRPVAGAPLTSPGRVRMLAGRRVGLRGRGAALATDKRCAFALFRRGASEPAHLEVSHDGHVFRVGVRRRATARRMTLRVSSATGEVALTVPERTDLDAARALRPARTAGWIAAGSPASRRASPSRPMQDPFRGVPRRIVHRTRVARPPWRRSSIRMGRR